jgi:hypothetical protein
MSQVDQYQKRLERLKVFEVLWVVVGGVLMALCLIIAMRMQNPALISTGVFLGGAFLAACLMRASKMNKERRTLREQKTHEIIVKDAEEDSLSTET